MTKSEWAFRYMLPNICCANDHWETDSIDTLLPLDVVKAVKSTAFEAASGANKILVWNIFMKLLLVKNII